jgi:AcrR family transcriptional regulator
MPDPETTSRQQRKTLKTRARLLDAARQVFVERGYDAASLTEVTDRADLGTGTFYLHFRDKRAVYEAVVQRQLLALRERWLRERESLGPDGGFPDTEIALMVRVVLEALLEDQPMSRLVLLDGPPVETWLVDEIGQEMSALLGDRVTTPELVSNLVIGAALNASRWALTRKQPVSRERLVRDAIAFCAAGVAATLAEQKSTKSRRPAAVAGNEPRRARAALNRER